MIRDLTRELAAWLGKGPVRIGEILIRPAAGACFDLRHYRDADVEGLPIDREPAAARALAGTDESGAYRPLKTAPNLRRGWRLLLADAAAVRRALDFFYPAMTGLFADFRAGQLTPIPLRRTLERQTGMYAITRKITDAEAQTMIAGFCRTDGGCLKRILWPLAEGVRVSSLPHEKFEVRADSVDGETPEVPLLCHEACNLLVAKAREIVKKGFA